ESQIESEVTAFHQQALAVYKHFGFDEIQIKIALRPESRLGDDATWDKAEGALRSALSSCGVEWQELPGEGAFYDPKFEYVLKDAIGREWQCGTTQVDFNLPERFGAFYIGSDSEKKQPVMVHRAVCGSMERFLGILI
ncbi:threonine--tRNA ligase, partial [bacterium M00.F.Ca.ET.155.01.1.1]